MDCTVKWVSNETSSAMAFSAETGSGHVVLMDGAPEAGGNNLAPRPMELVLAGTGGCTAFDVVMILKKGRHDIRDCSVNLIAERAETDPKVFTKIHFKFIVSGKNLKRESVLRAIELSKEKYCSASIMLGKTAEISSELELLEV